MTLQDLERLKLGELCYFWRRLEEVVRLLVDLAKGMSVYVIHYWDMLHKFMPNYWAKIEWLKINGSNLL